ncbi:MAG: MaoC family dehydratase [Dehalococcoidia bacterium]
MIPPEVVPLTKMVSQDQINRYADASGDHNPIHIDEAFAKASPVGGTVAHGMLTLAFLGEMMAAAFGERWLARGKLRVRFRTVVRPGDVITVSARPERGSDDDTHVYAVECRNQAGEAVVSGTAEVPARG